MIPSIVNEPSGIRLSFAEPEDIACWRPGKVGIDKTARRTGRHRSTISRELSRNSAGYPGRYRASTAQAQADMNAKRPKPAKLATNLPLRLLEEAGAALDLLSRSPMSGGACSSGAVAARLGALRSEDHHSNTGRNLMRLARVSPWWRAGMSVGHGSSGASDG